MIILKNIKNWLKNNWQTLAVAGLSVCFFLGASYYNFYNLHLRGDDFVKWSSPDETANYVFAKLYGQTGELSVFEKYNLYGDDIIRPRSARSDFGYLKPVSFLGMILLYGRIVSFFGHEVLPYLTPFFSAWGIFFFYLLIKKIFGKENAFLSAFLLAGFPVWVYYSARSMFHNALFISLLIIGFYFSFLMAEKDGRRLEFLNSDIRKINWLGFFYSALAGFFIGLSATVRTSEILWLLPVIFVLWIFNAGKIGLLKTLIFSFFVFLAFGPTFYQNQILYGDFINSGYPEMNESVREVAGAGGNLFKTVFAGNFSVIGGIVGEIKDKVFYFGFKPEQSQKMFYHYFAEMFYWIFYPAFFGAVLLVQRIKKWKKKHWLFVLSALIFSVILIFYYGSWEFYDNPSKAAKTIGNSYTRYWLPIYLSSLPLVSFFIIRFLRALFSWEIIKKENDFSSAGESRREFFKINHPERNFLISASKAVLVIFFFFISVSFVLYGSEEGLVYSAVNYGSAKEQYEKVLSLTETNSVIITEYHDKILFPERKVIVGRLTDNNMNAIYAKLVPRLPVYYYNFTLPEKDFIYLNERKLAEAGLSLEEIGRISIDFSLYRLWPVNEN